jgi:hypothetical protein
MKFNEDITIVIPEDIKEELEKVIFIYRDILIEKGKIKSNDVALEEQYSFTEQQEILLYIAGTAVTWFTKKWIDTYLWPVLQDEIDGPSKKLINWLIQQIQKNNKNE